MRIIGCFNHISLNIIAESSIKSFGHICET